MPSAYWTASSLPSGLKAMSWALVGLRVGKRLVRSARRVARIQALSTSHKTGAPGCPRLPPWPRRPGRFLSAATRGLVEPSLPGHDVEVRLVRPPGWDFKFLGAVHVPLGRNGVGLRLRPALGVTV